jgi:hypothetical protein
MMDNTKPENPDLQQPQEETGQPVETESPAEKIDELEAAESSPAPPELPETEDSQPELPKGESSRQATQRTGITLLKKALLWAAIVIGGLFFVLGVAGIVGVWLANTPVTNTILDILEPIGITLQRLETGSGEAGAALAEVSTLLDDADQRVQQLGANLAETNLVREALNQILDVDLEQEVENARQGVRSIYDTLVAVEETIKAINNIPFVDVEIPGSTEITAIRTGMEEMADNAAEIRQANQERREERAENLVTAITTPLNQLESRVGELRTLMTNAETRFGEGAEGVDELQSKVPRWIDIASIFATLLLAWLVFSQAAVIVLCWQALHPKSDPAAAR